MRYAIIGGSAAGVACVESIRELDKKSTITLISEEDLPLYSRCLLSYLLAGAITEDGIYFKDRDFFKANEVEAFFSARAKHIDAKNRTVTLDNEKKIEFDKLLIATGSRSKVLKIPGIEKKGVFALRSIKDERAIEEALKKTHTAAVLGGGLIGLKAAHALKCRGAAVKVVVKSGQVLSQMLDQKAASLVQDRIEREGITVMKGLDAKEISGSQTLEGVLLDDGTTLACELVVVGKGVEPNVELAKAGGIDVGRGIVVNDFLETSARDIFAAGDVAQTRDVASGEMVINALWPCAVEQGHLAGKNMAGGKTAYEGSLGMNSIEFFGLSVISMGVIRPSSAGYEELTASDEKAPAYKKVVLKDNVIRGFISVGKIENSGVYNVLIKHQVNVENIKGALLDKDFNYAKAMPAIKDCKGKFDKEEFRDSLITY